MLFPWVMADVHARSEVWDLVDLQKIGASHSPVRHHHARLALYRRLYTRANASISSSPSSAYFVRWTKTYLAAASPPPFFAQSASCALVYRVFSCLFFVSSLNFGSANRPSMSSRRVLRRSSTVPFPRRPRDAKVEIQARATGNPRPLCCGSRRWGHGGAIAPDHPRRENRTERRAGFSCQAEAQASRHRCFSPR